MCESLRQGYLELLSCLCFTFIPVWNFFTTYCSNDQVLTSCRPWHVRVTILVYRYMVSGIVECTSAVIIFLLCIWIGISCLSCAYFFICVLVSFPWTFCALELTILEEICNNLSYDNILYCRYFTPSSPVCTFPQLYRYSSLARIAVWNLKPSNVLYAVSAAGSSMAL